MIHDMMARGAMRVHTRRGATLAAVVALAGLLAGCGLHVPTDPNGALDRISGAVLHAGASPDAGLVDVAGTDVSGPLPELIEKYAHRHDAEVDWTVGSEESLVARLEDGSLDLAVGGMTSQTPWVDRAGVTRGYRGIPGSDGREFVVLVPLGENRLLSDLERFLDDEATP